jgi:signal transduction histidine kinase
VTDPEHRGDAAVPGGRFDAVRRGPLVVEVVAYVVLGLADTVLALRQGRTTALGIGTSPAVAVLVALRRRFPDRLGPLGAGALVLAAAGLFARPAAVTTLTVLALAVLVGAGCRRLPPRPAVALAAAGAVAMAVTPRAWGYPLLAVPSTAVWGVALALGLILRDADARRLAERGQARTAERIRIARELHDVVAHQVTGIVVRAQAARLLASRSGGPAEGYAEIEDAASAALTAMRRLVRMLRTDDEPAPAGAGLRRALETAAGDDPRVTLSLPDEAGLPAEVVATAYWVTLESLTNARRHAAAATSVEVAARVERSVFGSALVLDVGNDGVPAGAARRTGGFGLVGMAERVRAAGGTLRAGPADDGRWQVSVRLPVDGTASDEAV